MDADRTKNHRACPLCLTGAPATLSALDFPLFDNTPIAGNVELVNCACCGFVYYDTPSTAADFDAFYRHHYPVRSYGLRSQHPAEAAYLDDTVEILRKSGIARDAFIVDVGCGPGHFLAKLRQAGYGNLLGIELCEEYVEQMRAAGVPAQAGSATDLPLDGRKADCLIYKNIFEHFLDLQPVLDQMERHLAPGGSVLIEVPDAAYYNHFDGYGPLSYFTLEHLNHFDPAHLQQIFRQRGFDTLAAGTRMLDIAEKFPVPIQHGVFRRAETGHTPAGSDENPDFSLSRRIREWLPPQARFDAPELAQLQADGTPVHVWGLSYRALAWLGMSPLRQSRIAGFYDSDPRKQRRTLLGRPVESPERLRDIAPGGAVVIGIGPSSASMRKLLTERWAFAGTVIVLH